MNEREWSEEFNRVVENPPADGTILTTADGSPARLEVEITENSPPFIFGRMFVPDTMGVEVKWVLQNENQDSYHGWKCILMPRARTELIKKVGLDGPTVFVKSLRLVRKSQSGKSYLCEVYEYCDKEKEEKEKEKEKEEKSE